jgi:hypothetical protein
MATLLPGQFEALFAAYLDDAAAAPVLQTERLRFCPFRGADLPLLHRLHEDPRAQTGYSAIAEPWSRLKTAKKLAGFVAEH